MSVDTVHSPLTPTEMIKRELSKFLDDDKAGVIAIRGRWGVGKTYAGNEAPKAAVTSKSRSSSRPHRVRARE
jgi:hypothetical protein